MAYLFEDVEAEKMTVAPEALKGLIDEEYSINTEKRVDCSKVVNFFKERDRMCSTYTCENCPLAYGNNGKHKNCIDLIENCTEYAVEILQKWSDEHLIHNICPYCGNEIKNKGGKDNEGMDL